MFDIHKTMSSKVDEKFIKTTLSDIAGEVQAAINKEFQKCNGIPKPESALDQLGLKDGKDIVIDYTIHEEYVLALEHLVYMIEETEISLSHTISDRIDQIASFLGIEDNN